MEIKIKPEVSRRKTMKSNRNEKKIEKQQRKNMKPFNFEEN